jgi:hypothetical protein
MKITFFWILVLLIFMVIQGWSLQITPQHIMLYDPFHYKAHIIYYSQGHMKNDKGQWENQWKWPDYQYVEKNMNLKRR